MDEDILGHIDVIVPVGEGVIPYAIKCQGGQHYRDDAIQAPPGEPLPPTRLLNFSPHPVWP